MEDGEVKNLIMVWMAVLASLFYCHKMSKFIPKGTTRFLAFLPIFSLFLYLPLFLTTTCIGFLTFFSISWLGNFKLILFAFGQGPLTLPSNSSLPIPLSLFIPSACLPIKIAETPDSEKVSQFRNPSQKGPSKFGNPYKNFIKEVQKSVTRNYGPKIVLFGILLKFNDYYKENLHNEWRMVLYLLYLYFLVEIPLAVAATAVRVLLRVELEPQFDEPEMCTSVQDFWGKRWNIMSSSVLRPTVYYPVRSISSRLMVPKKWVSLPAVLATFLVSGLMLELMFYYLGRLKPTGEVLCCYLINGVLVDIEIVVKKAVKGKFRLHPIVSGPIVMGFVIGTQFWLFFPPLLRFNADVRICKEIVAFMEFVKEGRLVSSSEVSCSYLY